MKLSVDWIDNGPNESAEERATLCDLRIFVGNENACEYLDVLTKEASDCVVVAAVHLAGGIATNWWSIFSSRDKEFPIKRYREGFIFPDVVLRCNGSTFDICKSVLLRKPWSALLASR